ncbi:putative lipase [Klebsiella pneumoniae]|nr:putative lipase [Klebsiella pneumoniae]
MSPWAADMRLGSHVAAWATLSQADNLPSGENTLYLMGVSAKFLIGNCYAFETMWLLLNLSNGAFL